VSGGSGAAPELGPISVAQEAIFYQCLLAPDARSYNETISIRKDGPIDLGALRRAFNELIRRHGAWRTTFEVRDGRPVQVVWDTMTCSLPLYDLSSLGDDAEAQAVRLVAEASRVPYDLRRGPLMRPRLLRFSEHHHRLYLAMHHLIFDGVSVYRIVLPELVALYEAELEGRPCPLPEPAVRYLDYARWEQEWIEGPRAQRRLEHWRQHLADPPSLQLPLDRRRSAVAHPEGSVVSVELEAATVARLRALGQGVHATLFQVLAASWAVVLAGRSGQRDVIFSTAADLRQRPEFESMVGCSLTPLVLRIMLDTGGTFSDLVARTRNEVLDGLEHLVPFERIVRALRPVTPPGANPIYQTMVVLEPPMTSPDPSWSIHQMEPAIGDAVGAAKLDLELGLDERPDGSMEGRLVYDRALFDPTSARAVLAHWVQVVRRAAENPTVTVQRLLGATGVDPLALTRWHAIPIEPSEGTVPELIAGTARSRPGAPAVCGHGPELTYGELWARATATAERLEAAGIGEGDVVALCTPVDPELVVQALGVMLAGAAYLLADPALPAERLEALMEAAAPTLVYAEPALASRLTGATSPIGPRADAASGAAAAGAGSCCVQFVDPTGEQLEAYGFDARVIARRCVALAADLSLGPADTAVTLPENLYGCSPLELWAPLSAGARIVLAPAALAEDGAALSRLISAERASFLHATASRWQRLVETGLRPARGLRALVGLPGLDDALRDALVARTQALFVGVGGTETTGYAVWGPLEADGPLTCGRPRAGARAYVVDEAGDPLPPEVVGTLWLAGDGVASPHPRAEGWDRDRPHEPAGTAPAVRTGLRARWRRDGRVELID
jgi:non-ribosomal peptide synthetase component F